MKLFRRVRAMVLLLRRTSPVWGSLVLLTGLRSQTGTTVDRVGFPKDYATTMRVLYVYDRPDNKQVRTIYANDPVFSVTTSNQNEYPYGSILVMETWASLKCAQ